MAQRKRARPNVRVDCRVTRVSDVYPTLSRNNLGTFVPLIFAAISLKFAATLAQGNSARTALFRNIKG